MVATAVLSTTARAKAREARKDALTRRAAANKGAMDIEGPPLERVTSHLSTTSYLSIDAVRSDECLIILCWGNHHYLPILYFIFFLLVLYNLYINKSWDFVSAPCSVGGAESKEAARAVATRAEQPQSPHSPADSLHHTAGGPALRAHLQTSKPRGTYHPTGQGAYSAGECCQRLFITLFFILLYLY